MKLHYTAATRKFGRTSKTMGNNIEDWDRYEFSDEENCAVRKGIDAASHGEFAPDDEMEEFYKLHRKE